MATNGNGDEWKGGALVAVPGSAGEPVVRLWSGCEIRRGLRRGTVRPTVDPLVPLCAATLPDAAVAAAIAALKTRLAAERAHDSRRSARP